MTTPPEDPDRQALLDNLLADEDWLALNATVKSRALGALRAHRRQRRLLAWGGGTVAACGLALASLLWAPLPEPNPPTVQQIASQDGSATRNHMAIISDEKLMSYFPPGSCTIAEIDGQTRFIVLDPKIAAEGYELAASSP